MSLTGTDPDTQVTVSNGTSEVSLLPTVAANEVLMLIALRYYNADDTISTPQLRKRVGGVTYVVDSRPEDIPAGGTYDDWCSRDRPYHLREGQQMFGANADPHNLTAPHWIAEFIRGTLA